MNGMVLLVKAAEVAGVVGVAVVGLEKRWNLRCFLKAGRVGADDK